jgi:hypothetical protein
MCIVAETKAAMVKPWASATASNVMPRRFDRADADKNEGRMCR